MILLITAIIIYLSRVCFFYLGARKNVISADKYDLIKNFPFVSIIVPARNEEDNINYCLSSILNSNYPRDKFEVIVVDDNSTDNTSEIIKTAADKHENIKIITIESDEQKSIPGKPGALDIGIKNAEGKYLLMTDADCRVNENWIKTIVNVFENENSDLVCAFTLVANKSLFHKYQAVEWIFLHTMASGGIAYDQPLGCFGNNLSIKKEVYDSIGGFEAIEFSVTEDLALQQKVHNSGYRVKYVCDKNASVRTKPIENIKSYIKQRKRWAIGGKKLGWRASLFVLTSSLVWLAAIYGLIINSLLIAILPLLVKILCDAFLIFYSINILKEKKLYLALIPSLILSTFMELVIPFLLINNKVRWKGREY